MYELIFVHDDLIGAAELFLYDTILFFWELQKEYLLWFTW